MSDTTVNTSVEENQADVAKRRKSGEFVRGVSGFRYAIGDKDFPAQPNRYHLFVALNCPWSHRASLARAVLGLEQSISMDIAFPSRTNDDDSDGPNNWEFNPHRLSTLTGNALPECTLETGTGKGLRLTKEIYALEDSSEQSVPILYDKITNRIVNNESAEIIRMLNRWASELGSVIDESARPDLYPDNLSIQEHIDELNELIYVNINNGAYKAGFSSSQAVYAEAFTSYFDTLQQLDNILGRDQRPFLTGAQFTEADLRLFPTLYRHDPVYYLRMKLNAAKILDYPNLWQWLCRVYALTGVKTSSSLHHCRQGYFGRSWNNTIPLGPLKPMPYPDAYEHPELINE